MVRPFELHGESVTPGLPPYVSRVADVQNDLGRGVDGNEFAVKVAGRSVDGCTITTQSSAKFFETNAICACGIVVSSTEDIGEEPGTRGRIDAILMQVSVIKFRLLTVNRPRRSRSRQKGVWPDMFHSQCQKRESIRPYDGTDQNPASREQLSAMWSRILVGRRQ